MNIYVEQTIKGKPDCYGAPYVCNMYNNNCQDCTHHADCADKAIMMVITVAERTIHLEGVTHDKHEYANSVRCYLPKDYELPKTPLNVLRLELIKECHARSKHLINLKFGEADIDCALDDLLEGMILLESDDIPITENLAAPVAPLPISSIKEAISSIKLPIDDLHKHREEVAELDEFDNPAWNAEHEAEYQRGLRATDLGKVPDSTFPVYQSQTLENTEDALERLKALVSKLRVHGSYSLVRDEYCILSILLNQQGRIAPAFRPKPITGNRKGNLVFFEIHRDQVVIDCHWLYYKKLNFKVDSVEFSPLFQADSPFPFDLAWKFARKLWRRKYRTEEALTLTPFQQCQLVTLRGEIVKGRFIEALDGVRVGARRTPAKVANIRQSLNMWGEKNKRMISRRDEYEQLWLARELIGSSASTRQIAELFSLMSGAEIRDDKTINDKLKKMDRHICGV